MKPLDPCPYCMSETMQRRPNNFGGDHFECLDCGYATEISDGARQNSTLVGEFKPKRSDTNGLTARASKHPEAA